jgi:hypothetical protein
MKKLVEHLFNSRIAKFVKAVKDACRYEYPPDWLNVDSFARDSDESIMGDLKPAEQGLKVITIQMVPIWFTSCSST